MSAEAEPRPILPRLLAEQIAGPSVWRAPMWPAQCVWAAPYIVDPDQDAAITLLVAAPRALGINLPGPLDTSLTEQNPPVAGDFLVITADGKLATVWGADWDLFIGPFEGLA